MTKFLVIQYIIVEDELKLKTKNLRQSIYITVLFSFSQGSHSVSISIENV